MLHRRLAVFHLTNEGRTVFAHLLDFLPKYEFDKCVARYHGNFRVRELPTHEQFLVLAFPQLTWRESLRDIETCLASFGPKLYHAGIRQPTARNTLAVANETPNRSKLRGISPITGTTPVGDTSPFPLECLVPECTF